MLVELRKVSMTSAVCPLCSGTITRPGTLALTVQILRPDFRIYRRLR